MSKTAASRSQPDVDTHFDFVHSFNGTAPRYLKAFLKVRQARNHLKVIMDHEMLNWSKRVWNEAAIAAAGNTRLRDACLFEAKRYRGLEKKLYHDEKNGPPGQGIVPAGIQFDQETDWPHAKVIKGAIEALEKADIRVI